MIIIFALLFCLHYNFVQPVRVRDCWCNRLSRRWCNAVTCPDWLCLFLLAVSTGCPWPVDLEAGGGETGREKCVWAGWQLCLSGLRGWVNTLPLTPSFVLSISGIQMQLCTCVHKHAKADIHMPAPEKHLHTHSVTLSRLRQVFMLS